MKPGDFDMYPLFRTPGEEGILVAIGIVTRSVHANQHADDLLCRTGLRVK